MADPMSVDADSDDVMDALQDHASDLALGPVVALNMRTCSIKLRFNVLGATDAEIHKRISEVIAIIERDTDLEPSGPGIQTDPPDAAKPPPVA